jgi:hypothetical protein
VLPGCPGAFSAPASPALDNICGQSGALAGLPDRRNAIRVLRRHQDLVIINMRSLCSYRLAFLCVSTLYLNVTTPVLAAYREEWVSDQELQAHSSAHRDAHSKQPPKGHGGASQRATPRNGNDPIAAFAGRPADSSRHAAPKQAVQHAAAHEVRGGAKAPAHRKAMLVANK